MCPKVKCNNVWLNAQNPRYTGQAELIVAWEDISGQPGYGGFWYWQAMYRVPTYSGYGYIEDYAFANRNADTVLIKGYWYQK